MNLELDIYDCDYCDGNPLQCYCEQAAECQCGAYVFNADKKAVHIADCICGAD